MVEEAEVLYLGKVSMFIPRSCCGRVTLVFVLLFICCFIRCLE